MKKIIYTLILCFFLTNCGYSPIYYTNDKINFNITDIKYVGDQELNSFINLNLNRYKSSKNTSQKNLKISIVSDYNKEAQTKDAKGNISLFKVTGNVSFIINTEEDNTYKFKYIESTDLNNSSDTFDLSSQERSIKQNFASSIIGKLILDLSSRQ